MTAPPPPVAICPHQNLHPKIIIRCKNRIFNDLGKNKWFLSEKKLQY